MKVLTAAYVLPVSGPMIPDGAILIDDGRIVAIGTRGEILLSHGSDDHEEFPHAVLMPGLVNAHTHLDLLNFDGRSASGNALEFFDFLAHSWNHSRKLTPAARRQCIDDGIRQLVRSGTTCVGDTGQYVGVIPQAANSQMRMVLFPELLTGGEADILEGYEGAFSQVDEILDCKSTRLTAGLAPYAAYTLSRHLLRILSQHARELRAPVKIHAAETFSEMQFFYESTGEIAEKLFPAMGWGNQLPPEHRKTPIQYLDSIGFLENATLIGCNQVPDGDIEAIARNGARVVHSPRSNAHLKLGHPPIRKLRDQGIPVALGTDSCGALYSLSLWDEMRFIRNHYPEADQPAPDELLKMATLEGAKALGLSDRIGTLQPGRSADIIAVRVNADVPAANFAASLIDNTTDRDIAAVFVEGKRVKLT